MTDTAARPVRTRFAPSPTGYMHIGGMRTALFCWLWARHTGGTFILRIDDTDQERNVEAALEPIFRAFRWLGLDWDEGPDKGGEFGPYYQSQRSHLYQAAVEKLIAEGKAFRDFDPPEVTQADRQAAEAEKRNYLNVRRALELGDEQVRRNLAEGKPYVVRFLVPRDEKIAIDDAVRGHVEWDCGQMPDPVLMRSNGSFLYNFATVVDDAHMGITHIIRAEEHLANTPVQALLHRALGNPLPVFAHIPFITAPGSTKKMSKRDVDKLRNSPALKKMFDRADEVLPRLGLGDSKTLNPVMVGYYEKLGYLPAAILNALSRLGWSLDDKTEIMSLETVVEHFTLDRIVKSSASFDPDKLLATEAHWMAALPLEEKVAGCVPYLRQVGWFDDTSDALRLASIVAAVGDRLKVFSDILDYAEFFTADDALTYDAKALAKLQETAGARGLLEKTRQLLADTTLFDAPSLDAAVHQFVEREGIKIGQIVGPLRLAATGRTSGVGLFEALAIIGREGVLKRLDVLAARLPAA